MAIFPLSTQPIFFLYTLTIALVLYLSYKIKNAAMTIYFAFISRWLVFVLFCAISLVFIPENTLIAVILLVYLNTTFNPKTITG